MCYSTVILMSVSMKPRGLPRFPRGYQTNTCEGKQWNDRSKSEWNPAGSRVLFLLTTVFLYFGSLSVQFGNLNRHSSFIQTIVNLASFALATFPNSFLLPWNNLLPGRCAGCTKCPWWFRIPQVILHMYIIVAHGLPKDIIDIHYVTVSIILLPFSACNNERQGE